MFIRWLVGCLLMGITYSHEPAAILADLETSQNGEAQVPSLVIDNPVGIVANHTSHVADNEAALPTTTHPPKPFACYKCVHCKSKSDFVSTECDTGIDKCYTMHKRIDNSSQTTRRGCSTSKGQCTVPVDDQPTSLDSITCCENHECNHASRFLPLFCLSALSLFTILINILHI